MCPRNREKAPPRRASERLTLRTMSLVDLGTFEMETANLSVGGGYCRSDRAIPPMTRLTLRIHLPCPDRRPVRQPNPIEVEAVVVESERVEKGRSYRLALFFAAMAEEARAALTQYLEAPRAH
jgi:PilZ domain-containing protein